MGYYYSHMIGIRLGGVFSGDADMQDLKTRINKIIKEMKESDDYYDPDLADDVDHCLSKELVAHKGSYAVIAGVFNYWGFENAGEFCKKLSEEFGTEVMHMCWCEENDNVEVGIWLGGKNYFEKQEGYLGGLMRRLT